MYARKKQKQAVTESFTKGWRFTYKVGDIVRVSIRRQTFERAYTQKFTNEIFRIKGRVLRENIPVYYLEDMNSEAIPTAFYESEIQRVQKDFDDIKNWDIEKILRQRKVGKLQEIFVRYRGVGPQFDRWVSKSELNRKKKQSSK
jgi:hypothetical protein